MSTALLSIEQIKTMPEMVIPGVEGTLVDTKEYKRYVGPKKSTVQSFKIQQGSHWILGDAWGMQDLSPWRGKHVVFVSNKTGNNKLAGVSIKEKPSMDGTKTYKNLALSGAATMHDKDTYEASKGAAPTTAPAPQQQAPAPSAPFVAKPPVASERMAFGATLPATPQAQPVKTQGYTGLGAINGQTVGMATKAAIDILIATNAFPQGGIDHGFAFGAIHKLASTIIGVSQKLERGDLHQLAQSDSVVTRFMNNPLSGSVGNPPAAGYTKADTAGIESFENAIPAPRPRPTPGPGGSAFPVDQGNIDEDVPFNGEARANLVKNTQAIDYSTEYDDQ